MEKVRADHSLRTEQGFTYLEGMITLLIWTGVIPILFFFMQTLSAEWKEIAAREELMQRFARFQDYMLQESRYGIGYRVNRGTLIFHTAEQKWVRYHLHKGKLFRNVRTETGAWKGTTILLSSVSKMKLIKVKKGIHLRIHLHNQHADYYGNFMIGNDKNEL